jgi:rod shape-determining protein MreB
MVEGVLKSKSKGGSRKAKVKSETEMLKYFQPIVYARLHPDSLSVRDVSAGREVTGPPVAAISREKERKLVAVGSAALTASATTPVDVMNPFKHPRALVSDFTVAEQVLKGFVKQLLKERLIAISPIVVLHPKVDPEGDFTQIEIRALQELAVGSGAAKVIVWHGRDLADSELLELEFASGGRILNPEGPPG